MTIKDGAKGSSRHVDVSSLGIKSLSYISITACCGVCHRSTTTKQSSSGRQTWALCRELERSPCRPVGTEYCSRISDSIPGGTKTGSGSSSLSVPRRPANPNGRIVSLTGKQRGYHLYGTYYAAGFYSTVFLAPKKEGWWRPVINLKALNLNSWVQPQHIKIEGIHILREVLVQNDWLAKLNLKDTYFTIPVHWDHQKVCTFSL